MSRGSLAKASSSAFVVVSSMRIADRSFAKPQVQSAAGSRIPRDFR
jgi:hypothetical protein